MKRHTPVYLALVAILSLSSCGAQLNVRRIPAGQLDQVQGLVLNQNAPQEVVAVFPSAPGSKELVERRTTAFFASTNEYVELQYEGALFATRGLEVELHPDSSLKRAKITSTSTLASDLEGLTEATTSIREELEAYEERNEEPDALDEQNDALRRELLNLMLQANIDAHLAGETLPYPEVGT